MECDPPSTHNPQAVGMASPPQVPCTALPPADPMTALLSLSRKHAGQQAAEAALQPAVRALLLHPPGAASPSAPQPMGPPHPAMIPVGVPIEVCCEGEAAPRALPPSAWPPRRQVWGGQPAPQQLPYYGAAPPLGHQVPSLYSGMTLPPGQPPAQPFQYYQSPGPGAFGLAPPPPQQLPMQQQQQMQQAQQAQGMNAANLMLARFAAQQRGGGAAEPANCSGSVCGSGDASDATVLHFRSSFDSVNDCGAAPATFGHNHSHAPVPYGAFHQQALPPQHQQQQLCSGAGMVAFDVAAAAFDTAAMAMGADTVYNHRQDCHEAPSDSSDVEDGPLERQLSQAQVWGGLVSG